MHFYYEKKIQHLHCPCVYVQLERLRKMSLLWPCCSPMVPLLIVLNFRTPPFSEHDWMKIIYEPLFILNWSLTVDYMKSATRVELVIELMSVRNESFAWVSFLILTLILYQTSIFVMIVMRIKCQCSLWVEFIPPKIMDSLQKGNVSCIQLILSLFTAWIGSFFWCCIVLQFMYFLYFCSHCKYSYV